MTSGLVGAVLALIVFVITQSILKFFIEPIQEQKKLIGEIANAFVAYADVPTDISPKEFLEITEGDPTPRARVAETGRALRGLSGRLRASLWAIPLYGSLSQAKLVPEATDVIEAADAIIGWSNTLVRTNASDLVRQYQDIASQKLGIEQKYMELQTPRKDTKSPRGD